MISSATVTEAPGTALVTGATSGIGRTTAVRLASQGWDVLVHGRHAGRGGEVVTEIEAGGGRARFVEADLAELAEVRRLAEESGEVDVLVNNAGSSWFGPTAQMDEAEFNVLFDGNVRAAYFLVPALAPANGPERQGQHRQRVEHGRHHRSGRGRRLRRDEGRLGVAGPVFSIPEKSELIDELAQTTLLGRGAHVDEIATVIAFLAFEKASYITGSVIAADGGRTAI
jgi:NAD(P)-dependent dehydrogenase (short-subunit alcohol dehydrogenase family)